MVFNVERYRHADVMYPVIHTFMSMCSYIQVHIYINAHIHTCIDYLCPLKETGSRDISIALSKTGTRQ